MLAHEGAGAYTACYGCDEEDERGVGAEVGYDSVGGYDGWLAVERWAGNE